MSNRSSASLLLVVFLQCFRLMLANKVYELSDGFTEISKNGHWLVMFYAPWCGHCKDLEPLWNQVAQSLRRTEVYVGRLDCTQFPKVASDFGVTEYPTVIFFKGESLHTYKGERSREALIDFANRLSVPAVREVRDWSHFHDIKEANKLSFFYIGERREPLWDIYNATAHEFQPKAYFYWSSDKLANSFIDQLGPIPAIYVLKDGTIYRYEEPVVLEVGSQGDSAEKTRFYPDLNNLRRWVNHERFPMVTKITHGNVHEVMQTEKFVVLAVLEENRAGSLPRSMIDYKRTLEKFAHEHRHKYHEHFLFGWTGAPELANSFAMTTLPVPSLVVINATSLHHHFPQRQLEVLTYDHLSEFLDQILAQESPAYGGTGYIVRTYRFYYDVSTRLGNMWYGNPVLTAVLFGLPLGFLSLICYSIWCADILDATDDDDDDGDGSHEKKD